MLALPEVGINRSVNEHNCDHQCVCDWIESSLIFSDDEISKSDVVDILIENTIYDDQDFCREFVDTVWNTLESRIGTINSPITISFTAERISRQNEWTADVPYSFCMILSCSLWYPGWARGFGGGYNAQGELFEKFVVESMSKHFPMWTINRTGWSATNVARLGTVVNGIIDVMSEIEGETALWVHSKANEMGLDVFGYYTFNDNRPGMPVYFLQCASGKNWVDKRHTPDLKIWRNIISFASKPVKAFAIPFALDDKEFRQSCILVDGLFLNRYRLLSPYNIDRNWPSQELIDSITAWLTPRANSLPLDV